MKKFLLSTDSGISEIYSGNSSFEKLPVILKKEKLKSIFVIIDSNVLSFHSRKIKSVFNKFNSNVSYFVLPSGERSKSFSELKKIYLFLKLNKCRKDSYVFAIGGGVTGDVAGYAASTFMRGINLIHIPTSLLSMVDSSIGGKTAINFEKVKNLIGTIYQPGNVVTDPFFLITLPKREIISGIGEILKYGFLINQKFYSVLKKRIPELLDNNFNSIEELILQCTRYKASVVQMDETDFGVRKILNLGHTFAHSIESELNYKLSHGESVIFGLKCMLCLSKHRGLLNQKKFEEYFKFLSIIRTNKKIFSINEKSLVDNMHFDKKNMNNRPSFVVMKGIGEIVIDFRVEQKDIVKAIKSAKQLSKVNA